MPSVISKIVFTLALFSLSAGASAEPISCASADKAKALMIKEMIEARTPIGAELYTTNRTYQSMKSAVNECQKDAYSDCYPHLEQSISLTKLRNLFREWRKHRYYKLIDPSGLCLNRAYLLARELTESGYFVELIQVGPAPTIVSITRDDEGRPTNSIAYEKHWAVKITAVTEDGNSGVYFLDPQFTLEPTLKDDYFRELTGEVCVEGLSSNVADCSYQVFPATHQLYPLADTKPALSESCGWSRAHEYTREIENALAKMPSSSLPLTISYADLRKSLLHSGWERLVNIIRFDIEALKVSDPVRAEKRRVDLKIIEERRRQIAY